jgi:hypothetical protein
MNSYSPWHGYLRGQSLLPLEFRSVFKSLAVASPRISHPLGGGNHARLRGFASVAASQLARRVRVSIRG